FNTQKAVAELQRLRNASVDGSGLKFLTTLISSLRFLGFLRMTSADWQAGKQQSLGVNAEEIEAMVAKRNAARKARNFKEADRIRDELAAMGVELEDRKDGTTTWKLKR